MTGRVLLCAGDPNGIGPEIAVKAARELDGAPLLVGDRHVFQRYGDLDGLDVVEVDALAGNDFRPGEVSAAAGAATVAYLRRAVELVRAGEGRAIVACPHSETAVNAAGIHFRGYPPLLARLAGVPADEVFLLLVGGGLRITHVTLHERLADALARLTPELVQTAGRATIRALRAMGIAAPRLGVFGINPHAGEGGLFGPDDEAVTAPAVAALRESGVDIEGPVGADVLLAQRKHDGYLAMYHDQGHVPVKLLAGREATALAIGSGLVFASVGHGAAFDIAGRGTADPAAVLAALRMVGAR